MLVQCLLSSLIPLLLFAPQDMSSPTKLPYLNMVRRKNINLIQVTKEVGLVVNEMAELKKRPYCLGQT